MSETSTYPQLDEDDTKQLTYSGGKKQFQYIAALIASLTSLAAGMSMSWTSQISQELKDGVLGFKLNDDEIGWVGSLPPLGAAILAILIGVICDLIGRKLTMLLLVIPLTVGWALTLWPQNIAMLYIGRILCGMVGGAHCVAISIYFNEISQTEVRGMIGSFTQLAMFVGIFLDALLGKLFSVFTFTVICAAIPIAFAVMFMFIPETPVYWLKVGKMEKAKKSLLMFRGKDYEMDVEIREIQNRLEEEKKNSGFKVIKESFKKINTRRACFIGVGIMTFNTLTGIDPVNNYTSLIFSDMGMDPKIPAIILTAIQVAFGLIQTMLVERLGRKILLVVSDIVMVICHVIVATALLLKTKQLVGEDIITYLDYIILAGLAIFIIAFSIGSGPIAWVMITEIYPEEVKSFLTSVSTFDCWMASFIVMKLFIVIDSNWGGFVGFYLFAGLTTMYTLFSIFVVPETAGKSLEQIQKELGAN